MYWLRHIAQFLITVIVGIATEIAAEFRDIAWSFWYGSHPWKQGTAITVVYTGFDFKKRKTAVTAVVRARIQSRRDRDSMWVRSIDRPFEKRLIDLNLSDRGITWCWGWEGDAVRALHAVKALS